MKKNILAIAASMIMAGQAPSFYMQNEVRQTLAYRSIKRKISGKPATKGKRHASLKSRANRRK